MLAIIKSYIDSLFKKERPIPEYKLEPKREFPEPMESDAVEIIKVNEMNEETALEFKVKELRNNGKSYKAIAEELSITEYRIKKFLKKK